MGTIEIPLSVAGNYTVTEVTPPRHHLLPDDRTQSVTVVYGETAEVTFTNAPYGALRVIKRDAANGSPLGGASVRIRNIESNTTQTQYTDSSGSAYFDNLPVGGYEIVELTAPDGYVLDSGAHTVNVVPMSEGETSYTLVNEAKPGLRIIKFDRQTMSAIAGVTFEVWKDGELYGTYVTDDWGEIELLDLPAGTYTAKEIAVPEPYVLDSTAQWIELKAGQGYISELRFFNLLKPGIHLIKVDSVTLAPLPNARFKVELVGGGFEDEYVTDENGEIDLGALEPGAYTVTELAAPDGYLPDNAVRTVQINAGENAQFVFTNTVLPSIEVIKFDSGNGVYLPGATIRIAKIVDGSHYLDRVTDINGRITIPGLEPGVYSVQETAAPSGYVLNDTEYHVELFPGRTSTLVIENIKKPSIIVWKYDMKTAEPLADAEFSIAKKGGSVIHEGVTNADGYIELNGLDVGWYTITEMAPPPGYLITAPARDIYLEAGKTVHIKFDDLKCPTLTINKIDSVTRDPISGVRFNVKYAPNVNFTGSVVNLGEYTTNGEGQIVLSDDMKAGWYRVTELAAPSGYIIASPATKDIFLAGGESKEITFENIPKSAIVIRKIDSDTSLPVTGATFEVRYLGGTAGSGGTLIKTVVTSENGTATLTGLEPGTYVVEETVPAEGYELSNPAVQTAYITDDDQCIVELVFSNAHQGSLVIKKLDSVTGLPIKGVTFKVTDSSGAVIGPNNGEYTTDVTGVIILNEHLSVGTTVIVREIECPDNYVMDDNEQSVKIKENSTHTLTFYNTPKAGLQILKKDAETGRNIPGVQFAVSKMNGARVGVYTTDSNGRIFLPNIDAGWYTVTESRAADGYLVDTTPRNIQVKNGETATLTVTNRKQSNILIHKIDSVTGRGIYGVTFLISDSGHNPIETVTSDQNGYVYTTGLADGRYYVREIEAADGYIPDTSTKTFYIRSGATTEIEWENTPMTGQIQITKKSADDNPINGFPAGTLLEGAVFEIYDRAGNLVDTVKSGGNGLAISKRLPLGRYTIREVSAPAYYSPVSEIIDAEIEFSGQIVRLTVLNTSVYTNVSVGKRGYTEVVQGQTIRYDFSRIANNSTVPLDNFYWRDTLPTDAVRLQRIITGTWSARLSYKVVFKTNVNSTYRTLANNLETSCVYTLDASPAALGLASNEYITEYMFVFGRVPAGFRQVNAPYIYCSVLPGLPHEYRFTNKTDVGGLWGSRWIMANDRWVTIVYNKATLPTLPRTGY
jgi:uncharacterized surface anchored protein